MNDRLTPLRHLDSPSHITRCALSTGIAREFPEIEFRVNKVGIIHNAVTLKLNSVCPCAIVHVTLQFDMGEDPQVDMCSKSTSPTYANRVDRKWTTDPIHLSPPPRNGFPKIL